jgi:hypothetical protein
MIFLAKLTAPVPRLISQLFETDLFVQIGERHFQIAREIFSGPGNSPNFFSLGFAMFFASPDEVFPGLDRKNLLRPPAITPPIISSRSGDTFAELLHMLRGYPLHIRNDEHRAELLKDCRYYHFRGLEQKLIPHHISFNLARGRNEIAIRLEDVRPVGVTGEQDGFVQYSRPFVDEPPHELVVEVSGECMSIDTSCLRAELLGTAGELLVKVAQAVATRRGWVVVDGAGPGVRVRFEGQSEIMVDGQEYQTDWCAVERRLISVNMGMGMNSNNINNNNNMMSGMMMTSEPPPAAKRRREESSGDGLMIWVVRKGQFRLQAVVDDMGRMELVLVGVKTEMCTSERWRNSQRGFLT